VTFFAARLPAWRARSFKLAASPCPRAAPMLNLLPVRLRRRESVSLGRFQNCNQPGMNNFRRHGVEDESTITGHSWMLNVTGMVTVGARRAMLVLSTTSVLFIVSI